MGIDYSLFKFSKNARIVDKPLLKKIKKGKCQYCSKKKVETHTHHIKSKGSGGDDTKQNLIELCPACHRLVHDGKISKKELLKIKTKAGG